MNKSVILDSSALISLFALDDSNHELAVSVGKNLKYNNFSLVLPSDIITETLNVAGKRYSREFQNEIGANLLGTRGYVVQESNQSIRNSAFGMLRYTARSVSFTDCIVMAIAEYFETKYIFGFDHAFVTNGYILAQ